jgi:hypothetical protein
MDTRQAHCIWIEQCEAARGIKARYGLTAAFDYLIGEKLLNFINAASDYPDFARELPRFVSEVRGMFTTKEIEVHLARIERARIEMDAFVTADGDVVDEEDIFAESPAALAERAHQFALVKELLTATTLGTS